MSLTELLNIAANKENFRSLTDYIKFCRRYLDFLTDGIQAEIVSQNESNYRFFQYREDGNFNITRPVNANLMYTVENGAVIEEGFLRVLRAAREVATADEASRSIIRKTIYTVQQSIGATLDALPAG